MEQEQEPLTKKASYVAPLLTLLAIDKGIEGGSCQLVNENDSGPGTAFFRAS